MIPAELALTKTFMDVFVSRDVFETPDAIDAVASVLSDVTPEEAEAALPAFKRLICAVGSDLTRLRAAADVAVQFDLYEVLGPLLKQISVWREPHLMASAANLALHPAVDQKRRIFETLRSLASTETTVRSLAIREGSELPASTLERILDAQLRPRRYGSDFLSRVAPIVYVVEAGAKQESVLHVVAALATSGARVRRVTDGLTKLPDPGWASKQFPVIVWGGTGRAAWRSLTGFDAAAVLQAPRDTRSTSELSHLLFRVQGALPAGSTLRRRKPSGGTTLAEPAFRPDSLKDGAFDAPEMIYLGGASRHVFRSLARDVLAPATKFDVHRWSFDQLVTLRIVQMFRAMGATNHANPKQFLGKLGELAARAEKSEVGLNSNGKILVNDGDGFTTLDGQEALDAHLAIDTVFRPFEIGSNRVPDLLKPARTVVVDPRVLGGTPTVRDRRIGARSLDAMMRARGRDAVRSAYPELQPPELDDALRVGRAIDAQRG